MDMKCRVCLASSDAKMYHCLTSVFPIYLKSHHSVLDILQIVTSSPVFLDPDWPNKICTSCLKSLKESYIFIQDFHKAQNVFKENLEEQKCRNLNFLNIGDTDIKPEPVDDVPVETVFIKCEDDEDKVHTKKLQSRSSKPNSSVKLGIRDLNKSQRSKKTIFEKVEVKNDNDMLILENLNHNIEVEVSDHNYTKSPKCEGNDSASGLEESEAEESNSSNSSTKLNTVKQEIKEENWETIKIITTKNVPEQNLRPSNGSKVVVMTVNDVLNVKRRGRGVVRVRPDLKPMVKVKHEKIEPKEKELKTIENRFNTSIDPQRRLKHTQVFRCTSCSKAFRTDKGLEYHQRVHRPEYMLELKCQECGLQCKTKSAYTHHRNKHQGIIYDCVDCGKKYDTRSHYMIHRRTKHELGGLPLKFMCNECGRRFKYSNALKYHIIASHHKDSKKFLCGFCGFKCATQTHLNRHERCHTDERPYKCKICPKSYRGSAELRSHELRHEKKVRHYCEYCGKGFISTWNMKVHWLNHEGDSDCLKCSRSFADDAILNFHYLHHHKIKGKQPIYTEEDEDENNLDETGLLKDYENMDVELFDACANIMENDEYDSE